MRRTEATNLKPIILHRVAFKYDKTSFRLESFEYLLSQEGAIFNKDPSFMFSSCDSLQAANEQGQFLDKADAFMFAIKDVEKKRQLELKKLEVLDELSEGLEHGLECLQVESV